MPLRIRNPSLSPVLHTRRLASSLLTRPPDRPRTKAGASRLHVSLLTRHRTLKTKGIDLSADRVVDSLRGTLSHRTQIMLDATHIKTTAKLERVQRALRVNNVLNQLMDIIRELAVPATAERA
jgi:hypothetical protein